MEKWEKNIQIDSVNVNLNLDQRVVSIADGTGHDYWIDFSFPGIRKFSLPMRKTKHMRQLEKRGYVLKRNALRINHDGSFNLSYNKIPVKKKEGSVRVGIDMGRSKAVARSDGYVGIPLEPLLAKIDRKKRGSKAYQRAKTEIRHAINRSAKRDIDYSVDEIVIEKLQDMKRNRKWGNRSHHWRIGLLRNRVLSWAEEFGVRVVQVNPAYTSQTCSGCGYLDRENREKSRFVCLRCGHECDADVNAARVIDQRGAYVSLLRQKRNYVGAGIVPVLTG